MDLINQYLWEMKEEMMEPEPTEREDGEALSEKELLKIKSRQVKTVCCGGLSVNLLLDKSWQTKGKTNISVDSSH